MSAIGQIWGAKKAADATKDAAKIASQTQLKMFNQIRDDNAPYRQGGYGAYSAMQSLLGLGGDPAAAQQGFQNYQNSTGFQFRMGQGTQAIDRSAAARGGLNSGATLKALQQYGQNIGSAEFGNYLNQLQGVIAPGQQALSQNATAGMNAANNISSNQMAAGNARASAYGQIGQAGGNMLGGLAGWLGG